MAQVQLKNLSKIYDGGVCAVKDASFEVKDREFVILVGPSGCGKSTLLRMIAGLETISQGDLYIDGERVNDRHAKDRDIAMVFQNYALYPHLSVYDNMAFSLKLRKFSKDEIKRRVQEAAEILGLTAYLDRKPRALSGGQRQRVAVGRAIVRQPKVFLFDEPLSNLDAKMRVQMRVELIKLHQRLQSTIIYVTHDQVEAMTMGDKIVVVKDGEIQQVAPPLELYRNPINKFVAGFIGSPAMNFLSCEVTTELTGLQLDEGSFRIKLAAERIRPLVEKGFRGRRLIFGIRPEDIADLRTVANPLPGSTFEARIEIIEMMGNESFVQLSTPRHELTARLPAELPLQAGERREFVLDLAKVHLFDPDDEKSLLYVQHTEVATSVI
ncbi:MAG: sn-glycerol-3-phosphate ABC transporter ATP-binding protein UgpC [Acidobacteriota bacterium]